ncbi:MAG TPA: hypothetical protein VJ623_14925 [Holophagaceae bacterium]|nr:hypothetical protein [Holophagaceae bacterium]
MPMHGEQVSRVNAMAERVWVEERVVLTDAAELDAFSHLFPSERRNAPATHPIDLEALNGLGRPRGFLAAWAPNGLVLSRLRL